MENVFKNKNFILIFLGALVSNIGNLLYSFAVSLWILDITGKNAILQGAYLGVCGLTFVLFSLVGGVLSDRFNKAKIMYLCDFIKAIVILASAIIILLNSNNLTLNLIVLFSTGIIGNMIGAIFSPASTALIPAIVEKNQIQQANSYMNVLSSLQAIIGVCLAAILYAALPITTLFVIVGICYFGSAISEMFIKYDYKPAEHKLTIKETINDIKEGFRYIKTKKVLASLLPILILLNFFFTPIGQNFVNYFVKTDIESTPNYLFHSVINPEMWSAIFEVVVSVSSIIFGIVLSTKTINNNSGKKVKKWLLAVGIITLLMSVSYYIFVDKKNLLNVFLIIFVVYGFILGMMLSFINIPTSTIMQTITEEDKLGKVSSITNMVSQGLTPLATFAAGFVITYFGSAVLLLICSVGFLAVAFFALFNKAMNNVLSE